MKHSHRRLMLRDAAALLAIPFTLRPSAILGALDVTSEPVAEDGKPRGATGSSLIRPRIAPPKGSVMRRG
jgi:hypothetical protein